MDIHDMCEEYTSETNLEKKELLANKIVQYCEDNQDEIIPNVAKRLYIKSLLPVLYGGSI